MIGATMVEAQLWATVIYSVVVVLGMLGALLVAVVMVPWHLQARGELSDDKNVGTALLSWGFGFLGVHAGTDDGVWLIVLGTPMWRIRDNDEPQDEETRARKEAKKEAKKKKKAEKKAAKKAKAKEKSDKPKSLMQWWMWIRNHNGTVRGLAMRALGTFKLHMKVRGVVGLGDPADTVMFTNAINAVAKVSKSSRVWVYPDYLEERVDLEGEASGRVWGLALLGVGVGALFNVDTWKMLWALR